MSTILDHKDCEVFYCETCRNTYAPSEFDNPALDNQKCPECGENMSADSHLEEHAESEWRNK